MLYKKESSYGGEVTVDTTLGRNVSWSASSDVGPIEERGIGDTPDYVNLHRGNFSVKGTINFEVINFNFFELVLGRVSGAGSSVDPYIYSGLSATSTFVELPSFTLEQAHDGSTDTNFTFTGCKVESASLTIAQGGLLRCSVNWVGKTMKIDTTIVAYTAPSTAAWNYVQAKIERTNSTVDYVQDATINIRNDLLPIRCINSILLTDLLRGNRSYDFSVRTFMDTGHLTTLWADFFGQAVGSGPVTSGAMTLTGITLDLELSGPTNRVVTVALSNAATTVINHGIEGPNSIANVTFNGRCKTLGITEQISA